ncbi:MAG: putative transposase [Paracoccaceae bacterium]|jgi:putative transposase
MDLLHRAIDKSGANIAGLQNMNCLRILDGWFWLIKTLIR